MMRHYILNVLDAMGGLLGDRIDQLTVGEMELLILADCLHDLGMVYTDYLSANNADPLFCALLLRLGDLLDFDDTRAPRILYSYVTCNDKSRAEWDKHQASAGFRYPASPFMGDLPYKARCTNPGVEHTVRDFLDWIDEELTSCIKLQKHCRTDWQREFPFQRAVLRDEIESEGYMSGDFCLPMDQAQILKLLTGENLYDDTDVFIRELLQNAIDATLLRAEMQPDFIPEKAHIDLWEWNDKELLQLPENHGVDVSAFPQFNV